MNSRRLFLITSLAAGCFAVSAASLQINNPNRIHQVSKLQVAKVTAAGHTISAWLADDEGKNQEGMMFLTDKEVKESKEWTAARKHVNTQSITSYTEKDGMELLAKVED